MEGRNDGTRNLLFQRADSALTAHRLASQQPPIANRRPYTTTCYFNRGMLESCLSEEMSSDDTLSSSHFFLASIT